MDKGVLKKKLLAGLGWSAGIAVGAGALAALVNLAILWFRGYWSDGGALILGGTLLVMFSAALSVFPLALLFFWLRDMLAYRRKKHINSQGEDR